MDGTEEEIGRWRWCEILAWMRAKGRSRCDGENVGPLVIRNVSFEMLLVLVPVPGEYYSRGCNSIRTFPFDLRAERVMLSLHQLERVLR